MKILLILPAADQYRITTKADRVPKRKMLRFSILPLITVATLTPSTHSVHICDENVEPIDFETDADVIGISFMTALAPRAVEIAVQFRKKGKIVIAGGCHPTLCPEEIIRYFDAVVVGDAEILWPKVLQDIRNGSHKLIYRHSKTCSLAHTPAPRRDLFQKNARHYSTTNAVQIGRGCVHKCTYCSITAAHCATYRSRPIRDVIDELKHLPRDVIFVDDNIISNIDYAKTLFKEMIPLKKRWVSQCSLEIADDEDLLQLARAARCQGLFIGIETSNKKNLISANKDFNAEKDLQKRIDAIRKAKIGIIASIIVGMDNDDVFVFEDTLKFLKRSNIDAIQVNIMTPLPGTPLYDEFLAARRIIDYDYSHYDFRHVVIKPAKMKSRQLQAGADWLYRKFYRLDKILFRTLNSLWQLGPIKALLSFRLNMTYRYDNKREHIVGYNPAEENRTKTIFLFNRKNRGRSFALQPFRAFNKGIHIKKCGSLNSSNEHI